MKNINFNLKKSNKLPSRNYLEPKMEENNINNDEKYLDFEDIYDALVDSYNRKKYRKIFEFIDTKESFLRQINIPNQLFFSHMKMNCILKIIDKKFNKYYKSSQMKGIEKWFRFADISLSEFSTLFGVLFGDEAKEQSEYIILYQIKINYYHSLYSKFKNDNKEYLYYLILSEEIIKTVIDKITLPETFIYIIRIYLLLSNLLIQDHSIYSSINYLLTALHICNFIKRNEIELKLKKYNTNDNSIFITDKQNITNETQLNFDKFLKEINFLSAICFCLLGVCFENLNEFYLSNFVYRQSKWITENLLNNNEYYTLFRLLEELTNKSTKEKDIIMIICKLDVIKFINKYRIKPKKKVLDCFEKKKFKKYQIIEKKLSKLKLTEPETLQQILINDDDGKNHKSKKIKLMTNNVILLNYLSSDEFKPVIYQIKDMNIYNMNKETEMLIAKELELIKNKNIKRKDSLDKKYKRSNSKDSLEYSYNKNNNSFNQIKKVRSRKKFQTEYNKDLNLLNINAKIEKINPKIQKYSSKNLIIQKENRLMSVNKDVRKLSIGYELNENTNNFYLNDSELLSSTPNNKEFSNQKSFSDKKSSELFEKSFSIKNGLFDKPSILHKIHLNSEIPELIKEKENNKKMKRIKIFKKGKVPKMPIKYNNSDKYIFNKIYIKKLEHLEKLTNKEYKFQKGILRNKSYEQFPQEKFEPNKNKKDAELFYIKTLDEKLKLLEEKIQTLGGINKKDYYQEKLLNRKLLIYKNRACFSLNYKDKENYYKLLNEIKNKNNSNKKQINRKTFVIRNNSMDFGLKKINENNNMQMNILGGKIEKIEKKMLNKSSKTINNFTSVKTIPKIPNNKKINILFESKSTKNIKFNRLLIEDFMEKKTLSSNLGKDLILPFRKSVTIKTEAKLL